MRPTYARATWLFLRLLGLTYLLAFWSLHTQILGLVGHDGILPAADYMDRAGTAEGHLLLFDRTSGKPWEEKIFRRQEVHGDESHPQKTITVWGM